MAAVCGQIATARNSPARGALHRCLAIPLSFAIEPEPAARTKTSSGLVAGRITRFENALIFVSVLDLAALFDR